MIGVAIAAGAAAVILGIRLFRVKRQLRRIAAQLDEGTNSCSEKKITVSLIDGDLNKLAASINRGLNLQKQLRIEVRRNDLQLKDSIANLSHDLRTPLTSILGYLQLTREPGCPPQKRERCLQTVDDKAHVLKTMIDSLYELSAFDVQEIPLKIERIDLTLLVAETLAGQHALFQKRGVLLRVSLPKRPVWISGDRAACARIVQNLLNNAVRYADRQAEVLLETDQGFAVLSVSNPAPNLSQEDIAHLFDRFYTADKSRKSGGTGLGLFIVKKLLEKQNGKIAEVALKNRVLCIKIGFCLDCGVKM